MRISNLVPAVAAILVLVGCGGGNDPASTQLSIQQSVLPTPGGSSTDTSAQAAPSQDAPQASTTWGSVSIAMTCEAMNPNYCLGRYGMTIRTVGTYVIGPNASNQTSAGKISDADLAEIKQDLDLLIADDEAGNTKLCPQAFIPGVSTNVVITTITGKTLVVRDTMRQYCGLHQAAANDLLARLGSLLRTYYVLPF